MKTTVARHAARVAAPAVRPRAAPAATAAVDDAPTRAAGGVVSVARSLKLLELMSEDAPSWSLADIARSLEVNKAIAQRLIDELRTAGFIYRDEQTGAYVLTYKLSNLGLRKMAQTRLLDQSSEVLRELANETGELVRLGVVEHGEKLTWVAAFVGSRRTLHIDPNYRLDIQLNTHAAGRAWLYTLEPGRAWEIMQRAGIERLTPHSIVDRHAIERELQLSRERGYALSFEENELGVAAVAAPIMVKPATGDRYCAGIVSVAAPTSRMSREAFVDIVPQLLKGTSRLADIWPIGAREAAPSLRN